MTTPGQISGGVTAWYEHGVGVTLSGSNVTAWADQSANGYNLTGTGHTPTYKTADPKYGGNPTINFASGSSQFMDYAAGFTSVAQPYTILVIGNTDGTATTQFFFQFTGNSQHPLIYNHGSATQVGFSAGVTQTFTIASGLLARPSILLVVFNGASSAAYLNSTTAASTANPSTDAMAGEFWLGSSAGPGSYLNGKVLEFAAWPKALSATEIAQMFNYGQRLISPNVIGIGSEVRSRLVSGLARRSRVRRPNLREIERITRTRSETMNHVL